MHSFRKLSWKLSELLPALISHRVSLALGRLVFLLGQPQAQLCGTELHSQFYNIHHSFSINVLPVRSLFHFCAF